MRWIAAFVVFVYHVQNFGYFGGAGGRIVDWAFGAGATWVSFFFILSGFVLAWSARPGDNARGFWWQTLNPVSWSLTCEAFFYAAFPALYAALRRLGPPSLAVLVVAGTAAVSLLPVVNNHFALGWALSSFPLARFPEFVLGAAIGRLVQVDAWREPGSEASMAPLRSPEVSGQRPNRVVLDRKRGSKK
ncbi:acyltransferase family protein [Streptomyces sp. NPDC002659]|uniref:acyltransferase family protein n=1 Tax=Streptomyces sp. NPDC002659 TaxID=3364656 RepID=UPI003687AE28